MFVALTASFTGKQRTKIAFQAAFMAACVMIFFLVFGQFLIDALNISLPAFQIAGGTVLFLFALTMIFGDSKPEVETSEAMELTPTNSPAVFPLAVPSLASPGAMLAIVLLTDNNRFSIPEQVVTGGIMLSIIGIAFLLMLAATPILKVIGLNGSAIVSRVMGMILASVAVDHVISATIFLIKTTEL